MSICVKSTNLVYIFNLFQLSRRTFVKKEGNPLAEAIIHSIGITIFALLVVQKDLTSIG